MNGTFRSVGETLVLLRTQHELYGRLEDFAYRQRRLVTRDDHDSLLTLLGQRQQIASELSALAHRIGPIQMDWTKYREELEPQEREEAEQLIRESQARLQRVIESDEHDASVLRIRKQTTSESLRQVRSTGQAINAYRVSGFEQGRIDQTDEESR